MFALVDCNNFYVSCERLFRPDLRNKPVVVLSNNDGCIIARSNEVKAHGIEMGKPLFEVQQILKHISAVIFSSNYALYGDISRRVMLSLQNISPYIEEYSIDEAFLFFPDLTSEQAWTIGTKIHQTIYQEIGIPVSIGIAPTKTMAKLANMLAKKPHLFSSVLSRPPHVCVLTDPNHIASIYKHTAIDEVWGIGREYTKKLYLHSICTIADFCKTSEEVVQKLMTRRGVLSHRELCGVPCMELQNIPISRKSIVYSRSFSSMVHKKEDLQHLLSHYASEFTRKLRHHQKQVSLLQIFLSPPYSRGKHDQTLSSQIRIPQPTADYIEINRHVLFLFEHMYNRSSELQKQQSWKKAGIVGLQIEESSHQQIPLFGTNPNPKCSQVMDQINQRFGKGTIKLGSTIHASKHLMKQNHCSPKYTSKWSDIPIISL